MNKKGDSMKKTKMEHTPGPWKNYMGKIYRRDDLLSDDITSETYIASVRTNADALLISAAPELLAAAKLLMNWRMKDGSPCFCTAGENESEPSGKMSLLHATSCKQMRAAIAKAEAGEWPHARAAGKKYSGRKRLRGRPSR
jgi:hypothetical protein